MTMTMETSRKVLNFASVYNFVTGGLVLLLGILGLVGVGAASAFPEALENVGAATVNVLAGSSVLLLGTGVVEMFEGVCNRNAAKDPAKVFPALYLSIIMMAMQASSLIFSIAEGGNILLNVAGLAITATVFCAANSMKKAAGLDF